MDTTGVVISAAGGLALFLFGLRVLSSALKRAMGERMRLLLERLTGRTHRAVLVGIATTSVLQSSSMTMVLLIALINAGALSLLQGIGVMFGSEIGTSLTAQIIAFRVGEYYLPIIALGFLLSELFRGKRAGDAGRAILGFGLLFLGMSIMSGGLRGLARSEFVVDLLASLGTNAPLGVLIGAGVTAVIQSSSAMTALVIAMGSAGILTLPAAVALVLGANIGTTITAQLASVGSALPARRLARAQLLFNTMGVALFLPWVPWYARFISLTTPSLERQIANAHLLFNLTGMLIALPLAGALAAAVSRLVRGREPVARAAPQYLADAFLHAPTLALHQARREILSMGELVRTMIARCRQGLFEDDMDALVEVLEIERCVDGLKRAIERYLERIPGESLSPAEERRLHVLQHATGDIERIGDQAVNIAERGQAVRRKGCTFSEAARADLAALFERTSELYERTLTALRGEDARCAEDALHLEAEVDHLEQLFRDRHVERLDRGICDSAAGILFVEILHNLERIGDHAVNIAGDVRHTL